MAKQKKENLSEVAAKYLRQEILTGRLAQSEKIVENDIAEQLGVSRGPVRDALKQLMYEGFVEYETNKGYTVTLLSPKDAYEIFYLRGSLEKLALERCDGRLLRDKVFLMEEAVEGMKGLSETEDMEKLVACDEIFHRQILLSGQIDRLTKMWESLSPMNGVMFLTVRNTNEREDVKGMIQLPSGERIARRGNYESHVELLKVLKEGNLEKSKEMLDCHYAATGERIYRIGIKMENSEVFS